MISPDSATSATVSENPSTLWATAFVSALAAGGLRHVCISPGSRSTPLTLAFHAHPDIQVYLQLDERSAGFFALGLALATGRPVALLCTSGTAAANYMPAIIEARMSEVPLLVLTTDRPHELRHSGANQTIDQVKLFGDQVLWAVDMALPEADPPPVAWRNLRSTAVRALAVADGLRKGPVHLNFPFRKPLEPASPRTRPEAVREERPSLTISRGTLLPTEEQIAWLVAQIEAQPHGLIVAGPMRADADLAASLERLAGLSGYPILADPLSPVRFGESSLPGTVVCARYENYLQHPLPWPKPDLILRCGAMPVSKRLGDYLARCEGATHIHIRESGVWADEAHLVDHYLQVNPQVLCDRAAARMSMREDMAWVNHWHDLETAVGHMLHRALAEQPFDGAYVAAMTAVLPSQALLLAGNSLPIRHIDQFAAGAVHPLRVFGNRGASGIDGNISTGMGLAASRQGPVVLLVGDITLFHDSNGLLSARQLGLENVTIVLLNNNGGGIFQRLPVASFEPPFAELFQTAHDLDFAGYAAVYGFAYHLADTLSHFTEQLHTCLKTAGPAIIEVRTDARRDLVRRQKIEAEIAALIKEL